LAAAVWTLYRMPLDTIEWTVKNSHRADIAWAATPEPEPVAGEPVPPVFEAPAAESPKPPAPAMSPWPPAPPAATTAPPAPTRRGGFRQAALSGIVGGLVGALVATGVFVATDDGGGSSTTIVRSSGNASVSRAARTIGESSGIASIIAKVEPAVVAITTNLGAGTGFVITPDGYIVTNNHVIDGASRINVAFSNGDEKTAKLVGREAASDLAVLKVDGSGLATVELGNSDAVQPGDEVVAIGNALALEGGLSITRGIISGLHRTVDTDTGSSLVGLLQTDAAINPGNSGGPLVDADGRVIGINTAIANPASAQDVGFAIPISNAQPVIEDLRLGRAAAFLGVATQTVTPAIARQQNLGVSAGALVQRVTAGSAAASAGLKEGDVITAIAGKPVAQSSDVQAIVRGHRPGETIDNVVGILHVRDLLRAWEEGWDRASSGCPGFTLTT
jgi:putative serine protease PepD